MGTRIRISILAISLVISVLIVGLAYFNNYESILEQQNQNLIRLLLATSLINIIANIFQIIDYLEKVADAIKTGHKKKRNEIFYRSSVETTTFESDMSRFPTVNPTQEDKTK